MINISFGANRLVDADFDSFRVMEEYFMEDIFYLSPAKLNTDCMCKVFQKVDRIYVENIT